MADRTSRLKEMLRRSGLLEFASLLEMLALRTAKNLADLTPREMEETIKLIPAKRAGMNDDITDSMRFAPGHFRNLRELRAQCKKIACAPVIDAATAAMEHVGEGGSMVSRERQLTFTARVVDPKIVKGAGEASAMTSNLQEREQWSGGTVQAWRQQLSQATAVLQEAVDSSDVGRARLQNALQHLRREPPMLESAALAYMDIRYMKGHQHLRMIIRDFVVLKCIHETSSSNNREQFLHALQRVFGAHFDQDLRAQLLQAYAKACLPEKFLSRGEQHKAIFGRRRRKKRAARAANSAPVTNTSITPIIPTAPFCASEPDYVWGPTTPEVWPDPDVQCWWAYNKGRPAG